MHTLLISHGAWSTLTGLDAIRQQRQRQKEQKENRIRSTNQAKLPPSLVHRDNKGSIADLPIRAVDVGVWELCTKDDVYEREVWRIWLIERFQGFSYGAGGVE